MARRYIGRIYYQDYNILEKICAATGQHPYSLKRSSMLLANELGMEWPLRKRLLMQLAKSFGVELPNKKDMEE